MPMVPSPPENVPTTKLHPPSTAAHFTYNRVAWKLNVRKEVKNFIVLHPYLQNKTEFERFHLKDFFSQIQTYIFTRSQKCLALLI